MYLTSMPSTFCQKYRVIWILGKQCLIFLRGLKSATDADIRERLLKFLEGVTEKAYTIGKMFIEVYRVISLKRDVVVVNQKVHVVKSKEHKGKLREKHNTSEEPKRPCWQCGAMYFVKNCTYTRHLCEQCAVLFTTHTTELPKI